jgi:hypothetical protein
MKAKTTEIEFDPQALVARVQEFAAHAKSTKPLPLLRITEVNDLEQRLNEEAARRHVAPQRLVLDTLSKQLPASKQGRKPWRCSSRGWMRMIRSSNRRPESFSSRLLIRTVIRNGRFFPLS